MQKMFDFDKIAGFGKDDIKLNIKHPQYIQINQDSKQFETSLKQFLIQLDLVTFIQGHEYAKSLSAKDAKQIVAFTAKPNRILFVGNSLMRETEVKFFAQKHKLKHLETTNSVYKFAYPEHFLEQEASLDERKSSLLTEVVKDFIQNLNTQML